MSFFNKSKKAVDPETVIAGNNGELWFDNMQVGTIESFKAILKPIYEPIKQCGCPIAGRKIMGYEATGSLKMYHVSTYVIQSVLTGFKSGRQGFTIIGKNCDPANGGTERIKITGVTFDDVVLMEWEEGKVSEESYDFAYTDFDFLDSIDTPQP